jgi:hypothetical protein
VNTKRKTIGLDPKIIAQLVSSAVAWAILRYAGIELDPEAEAGIAALVGVIVGWLAPAPKTVADGPTPYQETDDRYQKGPVA